MARDATIIGSATDWSGRLWDVREIRHTHHGFNIFVGWPKGEPRGRGGRGVAIILTAELAQYLTVTRPKYVDLPIGDTTVKYLRRILGLNWSWDDWWLDRQDDLLSLTLIDFCNKHACSVGAASQRRASFLAKYNSIDNQPD